MIFTSVIFSAIIQSRRFTDHEHYKTSTITTLSTIIMATAQIINCLVCMEPVRPRQQGVQCDGCFRWSHRICNTGKEKNFLNKFRKPNVVTFRKENELLTIEKIKFWVSHLLLHYGTGYESLQPDKGNGGSTEQISDFAFQRIWLMSTSKQALASLSQTLAKRLFKR